MSSYSGGTSKASSQNYGGHSSQQMSVAKMASGNLIDHAPPQIYPESYRQNANQAPQISQASNNTNMNESNQGIQPNPLFGQTNGETSRNNSAQHSSGMFPSVSGFIKKIGEVSIKSLFGRSDEATSGSTQNQGIQNEFPTQNNLGDQLYLQQQHSQQLLRADVQQQNTYSGINDARLADYNSMNAATNLSNPSNLIINYNKVSIKGIEQTHHQHNHQQSQSNSQRQFLQQQQSYSQTCNPQQQFSHQSHISKSQSQQQQHLSVPSSSHLYPNNLNQQGKYLPAPQSYQRSNMIPEQDSRGNNQRLGFKGNKEQSSSRSSSYNKNNLAGNTYGSSNYVSMIKPGKIGSGIGSVFSTSPSKRHNILQKILVFYDQRSFYNNRAKTLDLDSGIGSKRKHSIQGKARQQESQQQLKSMDVERINVVKPIPINPYSQRQYIFSHKVPDLKPDLLRDEKLLAIARQNVQRVLNSREESHRGISVFGSTSSELTKVASDEMAKRRAKANEDREKAEALKRMNNQLLNRTDLLMDYEEDSDSIDSRSHMQRQQRMMMLEEQQEYQKKENRFVSNHLRTIPSCEDDEEDFEQSNNVGLFQKSNQQPNQQGRQVINLNLSAGTSSSQSYSSQVNLRLKNQNSNESVKESFQKMVAKMSETPEVLELFMEVMRHVCDSSSQDPFTPTSKNQKETRNNNNRRGGDSEVEIAPFTFDQEEFEEFVKAKRQISEGYSQESKLINSESKHKGQRHGVSGQKTREIAKKRAAEAAAAALNAKDNDKLKSYSKQTETNQSNTIPISISIAKEALTNQENTVNHKQTVVFGGNPANQPSLFATGKNIFAATANTISTTTDNTNKLEANTTGGSLFPFGKLFKDQNPITPIVQVPPTNNKPTTEIIPQKNIESKKQEAEEAPKNIFAVTRPTTIIPSKNKNSVIDLSTKVTKSNDSGNKANDQKQQLSTPAILLTFKPTETGSGSAAASKQKELIPASISSNKQSPSGKISMNVIGLKSPPVIVRVNQSGQKEPLVVMTPVENKPAPVVITSQATASGVNLFAQVAGNNIFAKKDPAAAAPATNLMSVAVTTPIPATPPSTKDIDLMNVPNPMDTSTGSGKSVHKQGNKSSSSQDKQTEIPTNSGAINSKSKDQQATIAAAIPITNPTVNTESGNQAQTNTNAIIPITHETAGKVEVTVNSKSKSTTVVPSTSEAQPQLQQSQQQAPSLNIFGVPAVNPFAAALGKEITNPFAQKNAAPFGASANISNNLSNSTSNPSGNTGVNLFATAAGANIFSQAQPQSKEQQQQASISAPAAAPPPAASAPGAAMTLDQLIQAKGRSNMFGPSTQTQSNATTQQNTQQSVAQNLFSTNQPALNSSQQQQAGQLWPPRGSIGMQVLPNTTQNPDIWGKGSNNTTSAQVSTQPQQQQSSQPGDLFRQNVPNLFANSANNIFSTNTMAQQQPAQQMLSVSNDANNVLNASFGNPSNNNNNNNDNYKMNNTNSINSNSATQQYPNNFNPFQQNSSSGMNGMQFSSTQSNQTLPNNNNFWWQQNQANQQQQQMNNNNIFNPTNAQNNNNNNNSSNNNGNANPWNVQMQQWRPQQNSSNIMGVESTASNGMQQQVNNPNNMFFQQQQQMQPNMYNQQQMGQPQQQLSQNGIGMFGQQQPQVSFLAENQGASALFSKPVQSQVRQTVVTQPQQINTITPVGGINNGGITQSAQPNGQGSLFQQDTKAKPVVKNQSQSRASKLVGSVAPVVRIS